MQITHTISTTNLGDTSAAEAEAYRVAVERELQSEYPGATVEVTLTDRVVSRSTQVTGTDEAIEERVDELANYIWARKDWAA